QVSRTRWRRPTPARSPPGRRHGSRRCMSKTRRSVCVVAPSAGSRHCRTRRAARPPTRRTSDDAASAKSPANVQTSASVPVGRRDTSPGTRGGSWVKNAVRYVGAVAGRGARSLLTPSGLRGTATEVAWIAAHVATYPFGVGQEKTRPVAERLTLTRLSPVHRAL